MTMSTDTTRTTRTVRPTRAQVRAALPNDTATHARWWRENGVWRDEEHEVRALAQRIADERGLRPRGDGYHVDGSLREFASAWAAKQTDETLLQLLAWPRCR